MKNLILYARRRGGKTMADKLAAEIVDAYNSQGGAFNAKRICIEWQKQTAPSPLQVLTRYSKKVSKDDQGLARGIAIHS